MGMKNCNICHEAKPLSEFHRNKRMPDGYHRGCKSCRAKKKRGDEKRCPSCERTLPIECFPVRDRTSRLCSDCSGETPYRRWHLKNRFGLSPTEYRAMLEKQGGKCAICGTMDSGRENTVRLSVDHCHETGRIRGLLCHSCNVFLGHAKDNPDILRRGAEYLSMV